MQQRCDQHDHHQRGIERVESGYQRQHLHCRPQALRRCRANRAYEPPVIERAPVRKLDVAALQLTERAARIKGATMSQMIPGEKLFYERLHAVPCTA